LVGKKPPKNYLAKGTLSILKGKAGVFPSRGRSTTQERRELKIKSHLPATKEGRGPCSQGGGGGSLRRKGKEVIHAFSPEKRALLGQGERWGLAG